MEEIIFSKIIKHTAKPAVIGLGLLASAQAHSAALDFDLSGLGIDVPKNYAGRDVLFVGSNLTIVLSPLLAINGPSATLNCLSTMPQALQIWLAQ